MKSLQGQLLVAAPKLIDPNFFKSVVLMVQHSEHGAMGLVLNRPLQMTIQAAWKDVDQSPCRADGSIHHGGPCEGPLMVVHSELELAQMQVSDGVYFSTEREAIQELVSRSHGHAKFFVGYAGWMPAQLEAELEESSWLVAPATVDQIFRTPEDLWSRLLDAITNSSLSEWLDPKFIPEDPSSN